MNDIRKGKGVGYKDTKSGLVCMIRCFACGKENWAMAVASGQCAWCGHDANKKAVLKKQGKGTATTKGAINMLILQDKLNLRRKK